MAAARGPEDSAVIVSELAELLRSNALEFRVLPGGAVA